MMGPNARLVTIDYCGKPRVNHVMTTNVHEGLGNHYKLEMDIGSLESVGASSDIYQAVFLLDLEMKNYS